MASMGGQIRFIPMSVRQDAAPGSNRVPMPMQSSKEDRLSKKKCEIILKDKYMRQGYRMKETTDMWQLVSLEFGLVLFQLDTGSSW